MKLRIEGFSCTEENLMAALLEAKALLQSTDLIEIEIKVFHDISRDPSKGHSWAKIHRDSYPYDRLQVYELYKRIKNLEKQLETK